MMTRRHGLAAGIDWITVLIWLALVVFGWMNIYSANLMMSDGSVFDFSARHGKQMIWIGVSIVMIFIVFLLDPKFFSFFSWLLYGIMILILLAVLVFGKEINGARSWFVLGGFQFQPSEFAKPVTALALAQLMSGYGYSLKRFRHLALSIALFALPAMLIILQPDLGSSMVYVAFILVLYREGFSQNTMILAASLILLFILTLLVNKLYLLGGIALIALFLFWGVSRSGKNTVIILLSLTLLTLSIVAAKTFFDIPYSYFTLGMVGFGLSSVVFLALAIRSRRPEFVKIIAVAVVGMIFIVFVDYAMNSVLKEHQKQRIYVTLGLQDDPQGVGYNVNQSKIAIGSGGFAGKGFLKGTQTKLQFVPEQSTDFIFCTVGEEWGFLGTSLVIILFVLLIIRLIMLAERQKAKFSSIMGYSLVSILSAHFIVNIGMTIGLFPVIGIPLPFFSYGGSSLMAFTLFLFIFLKLDANRLNMLR
jgi:rod shape determining protein RodA